jgi:hypothetical protein|tara:strand:- start:1154 stop:1381 length:228 start_codon:yes stop_codon:yes gene_type:complete
MAKKKPKNPVMSIKPYTRLSHLYEMLSSFDKDSDEYKMVKDEIKSYKAGERFAKGGAVNVEAGFGTQEEYYKDMY